MDYERIRFRRVDKYISEDKTLWEIDPQFIENPALSILSSVIVKNIGISSLNMDKCPHTERIDINW